MTTSEDPRLRTLGEAAAARGFLVVGVTSGAPVEDARAALERWVAAGHHADLGWMARNPPQRADPRTLLASVRTVVTVVVDHGPPAPFEAQARYGRVARYAWGLDYHDVVIPRLEALGRDLVERLPGVTRARVACDHAPILERAFATRAGLGFVGKNTCLILPRRGSWSLLGELLLDADLPATPPRAGAEHCGTCADCLGACPTDAFEDAYVLDARRCVSYLTIEHKGAVPRALRPKVGPWVFGCDVCQEVCPFNGGFGNRGFGHRPAKDAAWPELEAAAGVGARVDLASTLAIRDDEAFRRRFAGTPLLRPKRRGLLRNAAIVARNVGATAAVAALEACVDDDPEPLVRAHALWALFGLAPAHARTHAERLRTRDPDPLVRAEARAGLEGAS